MNDTWPSVAALRQATLQLLKHWSKGHRPAQDLFARLRLFQRLDTHSNHTSHEPTAKTRQLFEDALAILQGRNEDAANLLRGQYLAGTKVQEMTRRLSVSESHYHILRNQAIDQLTDVLLEQERQAQLEHRLAVEARLEPLAYGSLFGVERLREQLRNAVERPEPPWLVALDGIGGLGKTTLADQLLRDILETGNHRYYDIAWVRARRQDFSQTGGLRESNQPALDVDTLIETLLDQVDPKGAQVIPPPEKAAALGRLLKTRPYLVVIDNLETVRDYRALVPKLRQLANPTKILLTSRHSLRGYSDVHCLSLGELSQADALAFLKYEAESRQPHPLADATQTQLKTIYRVVGGNPLALKLVIGQVYAVPLTQVLENLKRAQDKTINDMYTFIYWQSWQALSEVGQQALLTMLLASPRGSTFTYLAAVSEIARAPLSQGLQELVALSLVDLGGDLEQRRYRLHRLTETFLLTEVTQWPPPS